MGERRRPARGKRRAPRPSRGEARSANRTPAAPPRPGPGLEEVERIAAALATAPSQETALEMLLTEARRLTRAEAGTIYVREGDRLRFAAVQNDALAHRLGAVEVRRRLAAEPLPLRRTSIASYVVLTRATVNLPAAYDIPLDRPYVFDADFDLKSGYRTCSMLATPLRDGRGGVLGVLQLINALNEQGEVVSFDQDGQDLVAALAARLPPPRTSG